MFFVLFCGMTWDASTVFLHLLCGCAFQIYSSVGAGCRRSFFYCCGAGAGAGAAFLDCYGEDASAGVVFCNLFLCIRGASAVFF